MTRLHLSDGGLETSLMFHQGLDLPLFAAFPLVESEVGQAALASYWEPYLALARARGIPFVVDTATWRANPDWASQLGFDALRLRSVNIAAARFARTLIDGTAGAERLDAIVNGVVGPRGDGYAAGDEMSADQAQAYHAEQLAALAEGGVDQVTALTLTYPNEAIGFVRAAADAQLACVVSFTVETDGALPNGDLLSDAVELVDAETDDASVGFMINCAHPSHFAAVLDKGEWRGRIVGIRANSSALSHAELDDSEDLDSGDPVDLAARYQALLPNLPALQVLGGCCGTDYRHIRAISELCFAR